MSLTITGNRPVGRVKVLDELPETGSQSSIYLIPNKTTGDNRYDEYIWIKDTKHPNGYFEKVGQRDINLEPYALKEYVDKQDDILTSSIEKNKEETETKLLKLSTTIDQNNIFSYNPVFDRISPVKSKNVKLKLDVDHEFGVYIGTSENYISCLNNKMYLDNVSSIKLGTSGYIDAMLGEIFISSNVNVQNKLHVGHDLIIGNSGYIRYNSNYTAIQFDKIFSKDGILLGSDTKIELHNNDSKPGLYIDIKDAFFNQQLCISTGPSRYNGDGGSIQLVNISTKLNKHSIHIPDLTSDLSEIKQIYVGTYLISTLPNITYPTKTTDINTYTTTGEITSVYTKTESDNLLDNKVDKVEGKVLSSNDFTNELKQTLEDINKKVTSLETQVKDLTDRITAFENK